MEEKQRNQEFKAILCTIGSSVPNWGGLYENLSQKEREREKEREKERERGKKY